jgi:hypothetical protein
MFFAISLHVLLDGASELFSESIWWPTCGDCSTLALAVHAHTQKTHTSEPTLGANQVANAWRASPSHEVAAL